MSREEFRVPGTSPVAGTPPGNDGRRGGIKGSRRWDSQEVAA